MREAPTRYVRIATFGVWLGVGAFLALSSAGSYLAGLGALFFSVAFLYFGLRRLGNVEGPAAGVRLERVAVILCSVGIAVVGIRGAFGFIHEHEQNFAGFIAALERYKEVTGEYPDEPGDLVPEFVATLPECPGATEPTGGSYYFKRVGGYGPQGTYIIQCPIEAFVLGIYESDVRQWVYTD